MREKKLISSNCKENIESVFLCFLVSWIVFLLSVLSPLIDPDLSEITLEYFTFFAASVFFFYFSLFFVGLRLGRWKRIGVNENQIVRLLVFALLIAFLSRMIDRFILRPPGDILSIASYREAKEVGSNIFSIISAFSLPFCLVLFSRIRGAIDNRNRVVMLVLILILVFDVALSGSRGTLLVCLVLLFSERVNRRNLIFYVLVLLLVSGLFFVFRFSTLNEPVDIVRTLIVLSQDGYANFVPASGYFLGYIEDSSARMVYFSIIQANQYLSHGFFEFAYIFKTSPDFQFDPSRTIPYLSKIYDFNSYVERENLYYTLFGTLYVSFGVFSLVACMVVGGFLGRAFKRALWVSKGARNVVYLTIFLAPFVNSFGGYDIFLFLISIYVVSSFDIYKKSSSELGMKSDI